MFEKEAINLYKKIKEEGLKNPGPWEHSPVEDWKPDFFLKNLNEKNLVNFRRTSLSEGLISFPDRPLRPLNYDFGTMKPWFSGIPWWQKIRGVRDISKELYQLRRVFKFNLSDINDNLVGNPCYYKLGGSYITDVAIRMFLYSRHIEKNIPDVKSVLEIGSGFGALCYKLMSYKKLPLRTYGLVDLPESLVLSWWYLKNSGFNVSTIIFQEDKFPENEGVVIIAPWMLGKVNYSFDLLVNTMSFQHMNKDNLRYYFENINRLNISNLYLVNRDTIRHPTDTKMIEYPILEKYRLIKEEDYPFSKHIMRIYNI